MAEMRILYVHMNGSANPDDDPEQNIAFVGGNVWRASVGEIIDSLRRGHDRYFVEAAGQIFDVLPVEGRHGWFLAAARGGARTGELGALPDFPAWHQCSPALRAKS